MHEVIVIGGGIIGSFAAYFLSQFGKRVTLVERGEIGGQASGINPGGLNPLHGSGLPGIMSPLAERAFALNLEHWDRIATLSGIAFDPQRIQRVELAFDEVEKQALADSLPHYDTIPGFRARWMERAELLAEDPRIHPQVVGGLWTEGNGMVSSGAYTRAVARAAQVQGARIVHGEVTGLVTQAGKVTGVKAGGAVLNCDALIVASGAWTEDAAKWLDCAIPVSPLKGELLLAEMPGAMLKHHVTWKLIGLYQTPQGPVWLGGTQEKAGFDHAPSEAGRDFILHAVARLVPEAGEARVIRHLAALRPVTPDGLPLLGLLAGWENAFLAVGSGPKGMLLGAGMGETVARLIAGMTPAFALDPYRPQRFNT